MKPARTDFFAVSPTVFAPFMREPVEIHAHNGTQNVRASVLLNQKDANTFADTFGDVFGIAFMRSDWALGDLPRKGAFLLFGHPERKLYIVQVQQVGDVVHVVAAENATPGF